jgi:hypothetical protein
MLSNIVTETPTGGFEKCQGKKRGRFDVDKWTVCLFSRK